MTTDTGFVDTEEISDVIVCKTDFESELRPEPDSEPELDSEPQPESAEFEPHPATQADPFDVTQEWPVARAYDSGTAPVAAPVHEREETQTWPDAAGPETEVSPITRELASEPESAVALPPIEAAETALEFEPTPAVPEVAEARAAEPEPPALGDTRPVIPPEPAAPAVDAVLLFRHDQRLYVYWQIVGETCARARNKHPGGRLCLKLISLRPRWDGAERQEHDIDLDMLQGYLAIDLDGRDAVVRAAIGWRDDGRFRPLAIAAELAGYSGHNQLQLREHPFDRPRTEEELATLQHLGRRALEQVRGALG
jgi:hypothetical protein